MKSIVKSLLARLHRRGLLLRSTLAVVLTSALATAVAISYTAYSTSQRAHLASQTQLNELLDTIESTLAVACFAKDQTLAGEVAQGLLSNSNVLAVVIASGHELLADRHRRPASTTDANLAQTRLIYSPFDKHLQVGSILLIPDPQMLDARVRDEVWLAMLQLSWQLAMVTFAVVVIMLLFIVRPIKAISDRLHAMDPTSGERLATPASHLTTEIGQLVIDINALSDRLVNALATERQLRVQGEIGEKRYHTIFDNAASGLFLIDDQGTLDSWNPAFTRLFAGSPQKLNGDSPSLNIFDLPWLKIDAVRELVRQAAKSHHAVSQDLQMARPNGPPNWVHIVLSGVGDQLLQGVVHDITHLKESEANARQLSVTDVLTGAANRLGLEQQLHTLVQNHSASQAGSFAVLMVNLDGFRQINDGVGLPAGDSILKTTAERLLACIQSEDTLARLAADGFCIILNQVTQCEVVDRVASCVLQSIGQTYLVDGSPITLHASVGIALFPNDGFDVPSLLRQAELALNSAKMTGGNTHVFFNPALSVAAEQRRHMESDLRGAILRREFVLFFQPVIDLRTHQLSGAEALIRWRHPTLGLVQPDHFIPLAEKVGLIVDIGLFVLEGACQQLLAWKNQGLDYTLSINVSGLQIPQGLPPAKLQAMVQHYGISPAKLALEITEGVMLQDIDKSLAWMDAVHVLGFRLYLDDFGTGYSSLSYLKRFPLDTLKVDQSFVRDMHDDGNEYTLVSAIIAMGLSLGLEIVAEGVELPCHVAALQHMGCQYAQGFYFSRPVPIEEFDAAATRITALLASDMHLIARTPLGLQPHP